MNEAPDLIIIDDDPDSNLLFRIAVRRVLGQAAVKEFTDAESGLHYIRNEHNLPDEDKRKTLIFLDINLPTMSGWEFLDSFGKLDETLRKKLIIYMFSSSIDREDMEKASANPYVRRFVDKPISTAALKELLAEIN